MGTVVKNPPAPGTPEWDKMITASKIPAMVRDYFTSEYLGLGYHTAWETYQLMTGKWKPAIDASTQAMFDDAHDAEDYAINVWKRANPGWQTNAGEVAYTDESLPFDNLVTLDRRARRGARRRILEVKRPRVSRGLRDGWLCQVIFQMGVSGIHEADLIEVPVYGTPVIHHVEWNESLFESMVADAAHFALLVATDTPPEMDNSENAKEIISSLTDVEESKPPVELPQDMLNQLVEAWTEASNAEKRVTTLENKVAELLGDNKVAEFDGRKVVARMPGRFAQSRVPKEHQELLKNEEFMTKKFDSSKLRKKRPDVYAAACGMGTYKFERKAWLEG